MSGRRMNMHISVTMLVRPRTKRAFSLAELLVTVGVIGLLVAIMLPPLQLARRRAFLPQRLSNTGGPSEGICS